MEISASKQAIALNKEQPHLNNFEIVLELSSIEDRLDTIEKASSDLLNGIIDGLTKQVNYLQDKIKELEAKSSADVVMPVSPLNEVNPSVNNVQG